MNIGAGSVKATRTLVTGLAQPLTCKLDRMKTIKDIAESASLPASEVSWQLPLAFLSPCIAGEILRGMQPADLTTKGVLRMARLPSHWDSQAKVLGFRNF